jgi:hypothetical protein
MLGASLAAAAMAGTALVVYQLRYDRDTRYIQVGLYEVPWGVNGAATFRSCLPDNASLTMLNTTGRYQASFRGTRGDTDRVLECVQRRPAVHYASKIRFTDVVH